MLKHLHHIGGKDRNGNQKQDDLNQNHASHIIFHISKMIMFFVLGNDSFSLDFIKIMLTMPYQKKKGKAIPSCDLAGNGLKAPGCQPRA